MKLKAALVGALVAGLAASFALGSTGPTTAAKTKCQKVELRGSATAGSVTLTVEKANKHGSDLVGTSPTLTIPAGAKVKANACRATDGSLTLRVLKVKVKEQS